MTDTVYLDHNSTSPLDTDVAAAMSDCFQSRHANPASQHRSGQLAKRTVEQCRCRIVEILGGQHLGMTNDLLVFTSGGTESDNLAIFGLSALGKLKLIQLNKIDRHQNPQVLISAVEHPAVLQAALRLKMLGFDVQTIPVDSDGVIVLSALADRLTKPTALVSIMLANNETGAIQPVAAAAKICQQQNVLIHCDAVQAVGKIPVCFADLNVDALSFSGHKLAGPPGIGGLLLRHGVFPDPMMFGGFQQNAIRPGTENVCLTIGLAAAMEKFVVGVEQYQFHLSSLRDQLQHRLTTRLPSLIVNSGTTNRSPQTLNIALPGINRQSFLMAADLAGLYVSTGSACASGSSDPSPVLIAMGLPSEVIDCSVRISFGYCSTLDDVEQAFQIISKIINANRSSSKMI